MNAINFSRAENFPQWYQEVIKAADMAESSSVRGCMVIKPWGYAIWENIKSELDRRFKEQGHKNAYFPLLIPLKNLEQEAEHVAGFAKECAVVTHHRLKEHSGKLLPDGKLAEPFVIRPTSETIIGECFANWISSYRDLPLQINQWANVMRWEMRTRLFLRTSEFLWQEGHTAHATAEEAKNMTQTMIETYKDFCEQWLALPVLIGEKTKAEKFPGAETTLCIEAMMQDKKALQAGTSHFLGQSFAKASNIKFNTRDAGLEFAWTTSWGVSTRLIGAVVMAHSDDDGLVLPPTIAPEHVVIMPVIRKNQDPNMVLDACYDLAKTLGAQIWNNMPVRVLVDDKSSQGSKHWQWLKKGVPIRIELGPRDIANKTALVLIRTSSQKKILPLADLGHKIPDLLTEIHSEIKQKAAKFLDDNSHFISDWDLSRLHEPGFYICYAKDCQEMEDAIESAGLSARCILYEDMPGNCVFTGELTRSKIVFAKAY